MSLSQTGTMFGESASYGGFADAAGGIVTIVLAIVGLTNTAPEMMISIATIVFGAALLIQGGAMLSEYAQTPHGTQTGGGLPAMFLVGAAGIVLGILALLGIAPHTLISAAIIAFGAALVLSANTVSHLHSAKRASLTPTQQPAMPVSTSEMLATEMAFGSATVQALAGLAAIVLGIIALAGGGNPTVLTLAALLALGGTIILTGSTLSATVMGLMRPVTGEHITRTQP